MPRGIPNKKLPVILPAPEPVEVPKSDQIASLQATANDANKPGRERLWALQEIARLRANG